MLRTTSPARLHCPTAPLFSGQALQKLAHAGPSSAQRVPKSIKPEQRPQSWGRNEMQHQAENIIEISNEITRTILGHIQLSIFEMLSGEKPPNTLIFGKAKYQLIEKDINTAPDALTEQKMAEAIGVSTSHLKKLRLSGELPEGQVWIRVGRRIQYSIKGYNAWFSAQLSTNSQQASSIMATASVSGSCGKASVGGNRTRTYRQKLTSKQRAALELR
ncbi:hypothetical protein [Marinobacterium marinum]|uniref:hypothetical protein n=1 Tax=Marinobacterium marinum TaxID=2756129 RepID=UPI002104008F|nr:hypothetical protein [Marinobacterium marinum]